MDNRIGRTADGEQQNVEERTFRLEDLEMFKKIADDAKEKEVECEKNLKRVLKRFPIYQTPGRKRKFILFHTIG